ncbi:hypothetical protein [Roseivirga sp. 4D4]|uniref:hypothetical protein n=1 Tax=Roseivirga sp. 4D4 TaxID=1889784 RepID=UPI001112EA75|nr:hypothetical protein [Roseivirga sp. 4D4]
MNTPSGFYGLEQFFCLETDQQATIFKGCFFRASFSEVYNSLINHHPRGNLIIAPINIFALRKGYQFVDSLQKQSNHIDLQRIQWGADIKHDFILSKRLTYGK